MNEKVDEANKSYQDGRTVSQCIQFVTEIDLLPFRMAALDQSVQIVRKDSGEPAHVLTIARFEFEIVRNKDGFYCESVYRLILPCICARSTRYAIFRDVAGLDPKGARKGTPHRTQIPLL